MKLNQRSVPELALRDENAIEMLRVWIAEEEIHCSIQIGIYESTSIPETQAWGKILADVAQHVTNALLGGNQDNKNELLEAIRFAFNDELDFPTSHAKGKFSSKN